MSIVSPNAAGLPDRRHFLTTFAAAGALGVVTTPALASEPGPIEAMWPEYLRLEATLDEAGSRAMDAEELYEEPPRPRWHPVHEEGGYRTVETSPGFGMSILDDRDENIAYLKDCIAKEFDPDDPNVGYRNKLRARRARKTLAKIEAWQAQVRRRKDAAGLTEAEAAEAAAVTAAHVQREAIFDIEATTFRELAFQAALLDVGWQQTQAERVLERLVELAGISPHGLA